MVTSYDLIVIGGGISGLGIAREAGRAGLSCLLLEAGTLASQTSNNTLRIIHGGFRYLQSFDISRTMRSIRDQTSLLEEMPRFVSPLPCLMPLNRWGLKSRLPVMAACALYHAALRYGGSKIPAPFVISGQMAAKRAPILADSVDFGALLWHDALMTDPRGVRDAVRSEAEHLGATILEQRRVTHVSKFGTVYDVQDESGTSYRARKVVNATGPYLSSVVSPTSEPGFVTRWCKAFNIVLRRQLDPTYAIGVQSPDGRLFFAVPRGDVTAIGTWYIPIEDPTESPKVSEEEIALFVSSFNTALPKAAVTIQDVESVDVGILPMIRDTPRGPELHGSESFLHREGYIELLSTKYTTFRSQGKAVVVEAFGAEVNQGK